MCATVLGTVLGALAGTGAAYFIIRLVRRKDWE